VIVYTLASEAYLGFCERESAEDVRSEAPWIGAPPRNFMLIFGSKLAIFVDIFCMQAKGRGQWPSGPLNTPLVAFHGRTVHS